MRDLRGSVSYLPFFAPDGGGTGGSGGGGAPAWFQGDGGADTELTGHIQARGWDKLDARGAALAAAKSHREAQMHIGVPPEQLLRLPKEAGDTDGWGKVWSRLGRPADEKGYDFAGIKFSNGDEIDDGFSNFMRSTAFRLNLPKDTASELSRSFVKFMDEADTREAAEAKVALDEGRLNLKKSWGANEPANRLIASNAYKALLQATGMKPDQFAEAMTALENVPGVGYVGLHQILLTIGQKMGEDKFVGGRGPNNDGVMTVEQAVARKAELMKDVAWRDSYLKGDAAKQREMLTLNRIITGVVG